MKRYFFLLLLTISSSLLISSSAMANPTGEQARAAAATISAVDKLGGTAGAMAMAYVLATQAPMTFVAVTTTGVIAGGCMAATIGVPAAVAVTSYGAYWMCQGAWNLLKEKVKGN